MDKLGLIADDFTGANDAGVQFKKQGLRTTVLIEVDNIRSVLNETDVIVIDTESRAQPPDVAYEKVREATRALKKAGVKTVYKKIDSTLRGNIGSELDGVMDELEMNLSIVAPAFPLNGRITVGGYQLVNQIPLEKTNFAHDHISPIKESYVPTLIQNQTKRKVGHVTFSTIMAGPQSLEQAIIEQQKGGKEVIVVDAVTQDDLNTIAGVAVDLDALHCGSAGLAEGLSKLLRTFPRSIMVISGSVNNVAMQQISKARKVLNTYVMELDPFKIVRGEREKESHKVINDVMKAVNTGNDIIVKSAKSREHAVRTLRYGRKKGFTDIEVSGEISSFLGEIVETFVQTGKIAGLALVGGDTAVKIIKGMGALGTKIEREVLPGIPICKVVGGKYNGLRIVTKAGGFGDENAIIKIVKCLKEHD